MPTRSELIAYVRSQEEICREITADALVYQDVADMKRAISDANPVLKSIEASCFDGMYITGDVTPEYLDRLEAARNGSRPDKEDMVRSQLNLNLSHSAD